MLWRLRSFPDFVEPCLPSPIGIHEIKHDGFRLLARRGAERVRLFTRNGHDWAERFPLIVEALNALKATTCLIDGEAITCSEAGLAEFDGLRNRRGEVHLCAFDLLELDGRDLRLEPLMERRRLLAELVRKPRCGLVLNEQFDHDGTLVFEHACLLGCEGIVSKRKDSRYRSGRSHHWVEGQESGGTSGHARDRRGLGQTQMAVRKRPAEKRIPIPPLKRKASNLYQAANLHCFLRNAAATPPNCQLSVSQRWSMRDLRAYKSMNMR
jgi:bifunctional non-homologous end joining protein LigD